MSGDPVLERSELKASSWSTVQLGEIAELRGRIGWKGLTAKEYTEQGPRFLSVHSLNYGDYVDFRDAFHISQERYDESPEIMLQKDDVLICKDGAGIGKLGIVPEVTEPTTINSSLLLIRAGSRVEPKYLYYCLLSPYFQKIVQGRLEGATTPHLYQRDITEFPVELATLEEQKRIVAVLDQAFAALDRARANAEANLADAEELGRNVCRTNLTPDPASNWETSKLSKVLSVLSGFAFKSKEYTDDGHFLIRIANVQDGEISLHRPKFVQLDGKTKKFQLSEGDILTSLTGNIGRVAVMQHEHLPAALNQRVAKLKPIGDQVSRDYLLQFLNTDLFGDPLRKKGRGAAQQNVSPNEIKNIEIFYPEPARQNEIVNANVAAQEASRQLTRRYERTIDDLHDLRQSILQKAFDGELT